LFYRDSKRSLTGTLSSVTIKPGETCILGRRDSIDSKVVLWSPSDEIEIEYYSDRARIFPSRIHASIFALDSGEVLFADLGSTSGSVLMGESVKQEPFVVLYSTLTGGIRRVVIPSKYKLT
jgi:pSer/pThr/pTyr-binding forkhead associated (FHA) protein